MGWQRAALSLLLVVAACQGQDQCQGEDSADCGVSSLLGWSFSPYTWRSALPSAPYHHKPCKVDQAIYAHAKLSGLSKPVLVAVSSPALEDIMRLRLDQAYTPEFLQAASGNTLFNGSEVFVHAYGGHQFGYWAGQLGDGRAAMLGECVSTKPPPTIAAPTSVSKLRWQIQLKGSGKSQFSREGDGRAVLRSSIREFLASEAMHALGIPTSRAISIVVSEKDTVLRDPLYTGDFRLEKIAVVMRAMPSWLRFGSFELPASRNDMTLLRSLVDFTITQYYPQLLQRTSPHEYNCQYQRFFALVVNETASLVALWSSVGFVHGVCNTDNFSIHSHTIDYGPFAFMDTFDPAYLANTSDDERMYTYERQPQVAFNNLRYLGKALTSLIAPSKIDLILENYWPRYNAETLSVFRRKLGLTTQHSTDSDLVDNLLLVMQAVGADFTRFFDDLSHLPLSELEQDHINVELWALVSCRFADDPAWRSWKKDYIARLRSQMTVLPDSERLIYMQQQNPRYILRNYMLQTAIDKAEAGDYTEVQHLLATFRSPFTVQPEAERAGYAAKPPVWSQCLLVRVTNISLATDSKRTSNGDETDRNMQSLRIPVISRTSSFAELLYFSVVSLRVAGMSDAGIIYTTFVFFILGAIGWFAIAPRTSDIGLARTMSVLTSLCLWIFWLCTYMSQLHPIIAPQLDTSDIWLDVPSS